jgi:hypothetical protein
MAKVYSKWGGGWRAAVHQQINTHFRPQVGEGSCFERAAPEEFDTVSTISDVAKMRTFSEHLPSHLHGLWTNEHSNDRGGHLYFEGKKFVVPASVTKKLKKATQMEYKAFGKYLSIT